MAHPGSGKKFRLAERDGCSGCHEEDKGQRYLHPAIAAGSCAACHNPHRGRAVKYLRDEEKKLCAACHESIASPAMQFLHKPIIDEGCRGCHGLHGSQYERLLRKQYPGNNTVGYNDKQYELCFSSCHNRNLLQFPDTSFSTKFRNGKRNLHYLHVNQKERGVNCKLCHAIHGGNKPALIAERVAFGRWQMPINFEQQGNTGSCQPGCHKHETYRHAD